MNLPAADRITEIDEQLSDFQESALSLTTEAVAVLS
jgi:hypothetical protein